MSAARPYLFAAIAVIAVGLAAGAWYAMRSDPFADCGGGVATGAAQLGGPFTLVDQTGATVTDKDVIDRPTLLYFGYTFCPDVCPTDVAVMAEAMRILEEEGRDVGGAFISIDPGRDTPETVGEFVSVMHPRMRGLTGTPEQVAAAAKAYRVYFKKAEGDDPEYYLMDHSAFTYLVAPKVGLLTVFRHGETPESIARTTACYVDALKG